MKTGNGKKKRQVRKATRKLSKMTTGSRKTGRAINKANRKKKY